MQRRTYIDELRSLQQYLRTLLDKLPIGILSLSDDLTLHYVNRKFEDEFLIDYSNYYGHSVQKIPLQQDVLESIISAFDSEEEVIDKIEIPGMTHSELYLLNSFNIQYHRERRVISVLTNVQQVHELVEQMNQTNRLALMSQLSVGISNELTIPVNLLIEGMKQIKYEWKEPSFHHYFNVEVIPQVDRINLLCQSLLRLSRINVEAMVEMSLEDLLDQVLRLIGEDFRKSSFNLHIIAVSQELVIADRVLCLQSMVNVLLFCKRFLLCNGSKVMIELLVKHDSQLIIDIRVRGYNDQCALFQDNVLLDELMELSLVKHMILVQGGEFHVSKDFKWVVFKMMVPIHVVGKTDCVLPENLNVLADTK